MTYAEKLKDPRWQKKRLGVLERAGWACEFCGDKGTTLNVHHLEYYANPWEVEDESLQCLCAPCHELASKSLKALTQIFRRGDWLSLVRLGAIASVSNEYWGDCFGTYMAEEVVKECRRLHTCLRFPEHRQPTEAYLVPQFLQELELSPDAAAKANEYYAQSNYT